MSSFTKAVGFAPQRIQRGRISRLLPPGMQTQKYKVTEGFTWWVDARQQIDIAPGFVFDGASVPFPFTLVFPRVHSDYVQAACLHDWLYSTQSTSRAFADKQFYVAMRVLRLPALYAWVIYAAVRLGGMWAWRRKRAHRKV